MTHREQIGKRIAQLRQQKGLTLRQMADMCDVTFQNINKIENGKYNVGIDILGRIADALEVDIELIEKQCNHGKEN